MGLSLGNLSLTPCRTQNTLDGPCDPSLGTPRRHTRELTVVPGSVLHRVAASAKTVMVVSYAARHRAWPGSCWASPARVSGSW